MLDRIKNIIEEEMMTVTWSSEINHDKLWREPQMVVNFEEGDSQYFPTWSAVYYGSQNEGILSFSFRVIDLEGNRYLDYIPSDMEGIEFDILL